MAINDRPIARETDRMLHWVSRKHFQYCENKFQSIGIGPGQVPILMELGKYGRLSQRDLAEKVRVTPATISGTLKRLERAGIIVRTGAEDDARVSLVSLSETGKALMEEARGVFRSAGEMLVAGFEEQEIEQLVDYLHRMFDNVNTALESEFRKEGERE
ncbi:MAG: MarR family winged helix-turn-helix transcriptional regulator [Eubacteriales bacterium]|nr:MarR family winged helix-turn-helix transcriptional regulator [Eubacteriales bacterium]